MSDRVNSPRRPGPKRGQRQQRPQLGGARMKEHGAVKWLKTIRRYAGGLRPKTCQFIAGEPSGDDSCKCGAPVLPGGPYCPEHGSIVWIKTPKMGWL